MTTPRKRTLKKIQQDVEVPTDTTTTYVIDVETDPSLLFPPVPASQAVGFGEVPTLFERVEVPKWKKYLPYIPIAVVAVFVTIAVWALTI